MAILILCETRDCKYNEQGLCTRMVVKVSAMSVCLDAELRSNMKCIYNENHDCENDPECNPATNCMGCGLNPKEQVKEAT